MSDKYRRIRSKANEKKEPDADKPLNEIRISAKGRTSVYIGYASTLWAPENPNPKEGEDSGPKLDPKTKKPFTSITFKATGAALSTVVTVVEIVKRRFKGVEQITKLGTFDIDDVYEPINKKDGLENITQKRTVSYIEVTLSRKAGELDKKDPGYQPALPDSEIEELTAEELLNPRLRRQRDDDDAEAGGEKRGSGRSRRKGGKGKGKGKGKGGKGKDKGGRESRDSDKKKGGDRNSDKKSKDEGKKSDGGKKKDSEKEPEKKKSGKGKGRGSEKKEKA